LKVLRSVGLVSGVQVAKIEQPEAIRKAA
jgi:hypothetical protein